jgi:nitrite reductase (NO-forming)
MTVPPETPSAQRPDDAPPPGVPGWVKVLGAVVGGLILLAGLLQLTGIGDHGPGRHGPRMHGAAGDEVSSPVIVGAPALPVNARQLAFEPDRVELSTGSPVNIELASSDMLHDLVVDEVGFHVVADRGKTDTGGLVFDTPGTYVGYCSIPGHRQAGMELEFVVADGTAGHRPPVGH